VHVVSKITAEITTMLRESDKIDTNMACFVNLVEFAASSLDILIYCFTKTTNWIEFQQIQEDIMLEVAKIIENNGASIAFPTTTLDLPDNLFQPA
jgi:MscS family membrane protein